MNRNFTYRHTLSGHHHPRFIKIILIIPITLLITIMCTFPQPLSASLIIRVVLRTNRNYKSMASVWTRVKIAFNRSPICEFSTTSNFLNSISLGMKADPVAIGGTIASVFSGLAYRVSTSRPSSSQLKNNIKNLRIVLQELHKSLGELRKNVQTLNTNTEA